jgi:cation diffusion facilitator CzcD-associated flavoprotein CzcO
MTAHHKIVIVGAGFGGLGMAIRLKQEGFDDFILLEKSGEVGGTWRDNTYPGAACDIQSHLYWFSFDEQPNWSRIYPLQHEILGNIRDMAKRHGLMSHIRFHAELAAAHWDDEALLWRLSLQDGTRLRADTLITAWGQLNAPSMRDIPGVAAFGGASFHSARWNHDAELQGRRIASIGNGPSAAQFIPELAAVADHLTVFQRSPNYIVPREDRSYTEEERSLFLADRRARWQSRDGYYQDHETWHGAMRQNTPKAEEFSQVARAHLEAQVADPVLREKLWPNYQIGCKRIVISDDFLPAMARPNVSLVTERISHIEAAGIRTQDGVLHEVDVIVYGTGFETQQFAGAADIVGRDGRSLREEWQAAPRAYLGMTVPGFPNFYMLYGPNTNLGHNSILMMLECQIDYVLQAIGEVERKGGAPLEVKSEALAQFYDRLQADLRGSSWAGSCKSWYKTADGLVTNNWSGSVEDYKALTGKIDIMHYTFLPVSVRADD